MRHIIHIAVYGSWDRTCRTLPSHSTCCTVTTVVLTSKSYPGSQMLEAGCYLQIAPHNLPFASPHGTDSMSLDQDRRGSEMLLYHRGNFVEDFVEEHEAENNAGSGSSLLPFVFPLCGDCLLLPCPVILLLETPDNGDLSSLLQRPAFKHLSPFYRLDTITLGYGLGRVPLDRFGFWCRE
jgi:hypothetical protein